MTKEQIIWVATLQKAIKANFALVNTGTPMGADTRYEYTYDCPRAMFYGIMTEELGEDYARDFVTTSGYTDYDKMIFQYNNLLLYKEVSSKKGSKKTWKRYQAKRQAILNYFKYGRK
jgi:hypothetical protein